MAEHMVVFFSRWMASFWKDPSPKKMLRNILSIIFENIFGRRVLSKFGRNLFVFGKVLYTSYTLTNGICVEGNSLKKTTIYAGFFRNRRFQVDIIG